MDPCSEWSASIPNRSPVCSFWSRFFWMFLRHQLCQSGKVQCGPAPPPPPFGKMEQLRSFESRGSDAQPHAGKTLWVILIRLLPEDDSAPCFPNRFPLDRTEGL